MLSASSTQRRVPRGWDDEQQLTEDIAALARRYGRYGYRKIERFFSKLKQFRRVATRYDKLLANYMGFVKLAAIAMTQIVKSSPRPRRCGRIAT